MQNQELKNQKSELKDAVATLKNSFLFVGFVSMFTNILMLVSPLYMLQLYDRVLMSRSVDTLILLTIIVVILFITYGLLEMVRSRLLVRIGNRFDLMLSNRVFNSLFVLANQFPSKASSQPLTDLTTVRQYMSSHAVFGFFDSPWIPIYIIVLFLFHPLFGYFAIFSAIILTIISILNQKLTKDKLQEAAELSTVSNRFIESNLRNAEVVNAMGMIDNIKQRWQVRYYSFLNAQTDASDQGGIWSNSSKTLRMMFQSLILGLGGYLVIVGELSPGMMIAGSIILGRALAPLDLLTNSWKQFSGAKTSYERLNIFLQSFPEKKEYMKLPAPKGELLLENIVVVPPGAKQASLMQISMTINKGDIVGIIGHSAAGKSSLARAVLGIWPLHSGKVRLDKSDINQWKKEDLGEYIGYLPQDIELFEGTISENIARFGEVNADKVLESASLAGVHEMILRLPEGYDTKIGLGGTSLSGGQRQRIGFARAIYGDPVFVVLDEPNSNLDDAGELALLQAINRLKSKQTTVIVITHRLDILQATTKLAVLKAGTLQMYGNKDAVLAKLYPAKAKPKPRPQTKTAIPVVSLSKPGA